jgi:DNA primase
MIITEGFHEVMRSWEAEVRNIVAICGSKPDNNGLQLRLIMKYSRDIILALDNDRAGIEGTEILGKALEKLCRVRVAIVKDAKDLGELRDYDKIRQTIQEAIDFKTWLKSLEQKTVAGVL